MYVVVANGHPILEFAVQEQGSDDDICLCFDKAPAEFIARAMNHYRAMLENIAHQIHHCGTMTLKSIESMHPDDQTIIKARITELIG